MSQKSIDLSKEKDLLYFKGLGLSAGITTANFKAPTGDDYLSPEEHLMSLLGADQFIKSDPKRLAKTVVIKADDSRNYYTEDALFYIQSDRNLNPVLMMAADDEPIVIIFNAKLNFLALINGSWENIILNLVHSSWGLIRSKFDINVAETRVWIWPGLCRDCFQPTKDLFTYLVAENKKIDLRNNLQRQLIGVGIKEENIYSTHLCPSHSQSDNGYFFHSQSRNHSDDGPLNLLFVKLDA